MSASILSTWARNYFDDYSSLATEEPEPDVECENPDCCELAIYGEPVCARHMIEEVWAEMKRTGGHEGNWNQINSLRREYHLQRVSPITE